MNIAAKFLTPTKNYLIQYRNKLCKFKELLMNFHLNDKVQNSAWT